MPVVESQETVNGQLRAKVIVFAGEELLAHTRADLRLEIEDRAKAKISSFATLVVFGVLDFASATESVHTGVDIFVQMKTFLRFRNTSTSRHVKCVEEIGMSVITIVGMVLKSTGLDLVIR